jgi:hypothetical protein
MGKVTLNTPEGAINILIEGDQPNVEESIKIANILRDRQAGKQVSNEASEQEKLEQLFDTNTGIKSASLRAALSASENNAEEDLVFGKFGISEGEYLRDKRGRLALTPEGAAKLGLTVERNTLIDEDGFSRYDLADLAGIAPELIVGIGGAMKGAAIGSVIPGIGTIFGGAIGAAIGAGTGQGVEEIIEAAAGVSKQSAGEIAKDIGTEAAIGFVGDGLFGLLGKAFRVGKKSMTAGKELTAEELEIAGKSIGMGILPSLSAIRAPSVIARTQAIGEKIFKTSDRLKKNNDVMGQKINAFRNASGANTADEAGEALLRGLKENNAGLIKAEAEARKAVLKQFEDTANTFGAAASRNAYIDDEVFELLANAQNNFGQLMSQNFKAVDNLMDSVTGSKAFIPIKEFDAKVNALLKDYAGATDRSGIDITRALQGMQNIGGKNFNKKASFNQLYILRKSLNDNAMAGESTVSNVLKPFVNDIDRILKSTDLEAVAQGAKMTSDEVTLLTKAQGSLDKARADFAKGKQLLEDLSGNRTLKDLDDYVRNNVEPVDPKIYKDLIKPNSPKFLERAFTVLDEFGQPGSSQLLRDELANNFVKDALSKSGIDSFSTVPFSGKAFADAIDGLGTTGKVLFGGETQYNSIKSLANQIRITSLGKIDDNIIDNVINQGGSQNLKGLLQSVKNAQVNVHNLQASSVRNKLANGNLNATEAGELIANNSTKATDIQDILTYFRKTQNPPDEEAVKKIQGYFMNSLIDDFGETVMTDGKKLNKFADRMLEASKGDKLNVLYGPKMGKEMTEFAKILKFNARTAEGGDLVAASIAASPLQNIGSLLRFGLIGRYLTSAPYYDQILKQYKNGVRIAKTDAERARTLGQAMRNAFSQGPGQFMQEGISEGADQIEALANNYGVTSALKNTANQVRTNVRPQASAGTGINVAPPVTNSGLGSINVNSPGTGALLGLSPTNQAIAARQQP